MTTKAEEKKTDETQEGQEDLENKGEGDAQGKEGGGEGKGGEDTRDAEIARLKAENDALKARPVPATTSTQTQAVVTSSQLRQLSDSDWAPLEEKTGQTRQQILASVEAHEAKQSAHQSEARWRIAEALDDAADKDPQVHKLKSAMREYLADVPLEDKLDAAKLARHLDRAKTFAKGRLAEKGGFRAPAQSGNANTGRSGVKDQGPTGEGDAGDEGEADGKIKGGAEIQLGKFTLKVRDLPEKLKAREKELHHPDDPNGVYFKGWDKKPIFKR